MIKQIGLTGGIGSGKSTVAKIFKTLGYEVYLADDWARFLTDNDPGIRKSILDVFGKTVFTKQGELDRKKLGNLVFKDQLKLQELNKIIHPVVFQHYEEWLASIPAHYTKKFILKEAAILFESGSYEQSDAIITVYAPKNIRIQRVRERDGCSQNAVLQRMQNQWVSELKIKKSQVTIFNDGQHLLIPQVESAIRLLESHILNDGA